MIGCRVRRNRGRPQKESYLGKGKRFLILGCLSIITIFFLVLGLGYYYVVKPVNVAILFPVPHPEATTFARFWIPSEEDPSYVVLRDTLGKYLESQRTPQGINDEEIQQFQEFLPKMVPIVVEINKFSEEDGYSLKFQAAGYGNMQRFAWTMIHNGADERDRREYKDYPMLEIEGGDWLSFVDGSFYFSKTSTGLEKVLDLLESPYIEQADKSYYTELSPDSPLKHVNTAAGFFGYSSDPWLPWLANHFQDPALIAPPLNNYTRSTWSFSFIDATTTQVKLQLYVDKNPEIEAYLQDLIKQIESDTQSEWKQLVVMQNEDGYQIQADVHGFDRIVTHIFEKNR